MTDLPPTPEELFEQARRGDPASLGLLLYRDNQASLLAVLRRRYPRSLLRKVDLADLVQECFREAIEGFAGFRGTDLAAFREWLRGILENVRLRSLRYWARTSRNPDVERELPAEAAPTTAPPVVDGLVRAEEEASLRQAIDQLGPDDRRLYDLRFVDHLTFEEIAARLGGNAPAYRKAALRLAAKLRSGVQLLADLRRRREPAPLQRAVCLRHFRACSTTEIAGDLAVSVGEARDWVERGRPYLGRLAATGGDS